MVKTKILDYLGKEGSYKKYKILNGNSNNNFGDGIWFSEDGNEMLISEDFKGGFKTKSEYYQYLEEVFEDYSQIEQ